MASDHPTPRILTSTISLGAFSVFSMVLGLAGTVIITRHYSAEEFGVFTLILVIVTFLSQMSVLGLDLSVSRFIAGAKDEISKEHFLGTAMIVKIITVFLLSLLAWSGVPLLQMLFGKSLLSSFVVFALPLFAVESLRGLLKSILQGCLLFSKIGIADLLASLVNFGLLIVFVYIINVDIYWLIAARIFSSLIACAFALMVIPIRKRIYFDLASFKELMKFGLPLQLNGILNFIYSRIDTIMIAAFLGPAEIALYEVARKIPDYLRNLYEPFISVYYPVFGKQYALNDKQHAGELLNNALRFVTFITILGAVIAVLFGREIIQLLFSEKYSAGGVIFAILMINQSIVLISNIMGYSLVAVGDSDKPVIINTFNTISSWLGCVILVPLYALTGAAVANTIGTLVAFPLNRYFLRKKIELKDLSFLKPLILFFLWCLLVFIIKPELLLVKLGFLVAFLLASVFLSIITKDDVAFLLEGSGVGAWLPFKRLAMWVSKS
jgi:O-antigen/teichoic acid export membrane protein